MAKCAQCGVTNPEDRQTCYGCGSWLITFNFEAPSPASLATFIETPPPVSEADPNEGQPEDVSGFR